MSYSKQHNMVMAFIYMHWAHLEEHEIAPEQLANHMERSWEESHGKLDRKHLIEEMTKGRTIRTTEMPDYWKAAIQIIRSRTEYF